MLLQGLAFAVLGGGVAGGAIYLIRQHQLRLRTAETARWSGAFYLRREWLEAGFHKVAAERGTPRGLVWEECEFEDDVVFARDRRTGEPTALVGVTIRFSAVAGGGMEDVEAVANRKAATAVFRYRTGEWTTDGRAVFNLSPHETVNYYHADLARVESESLQRSRRRPASPGSTAPKL